MANSADTIANNGRQAAAIKDQEMAVERLSRMLTLIKADNLKAGGTNPALVILQMGMEKVCFDENAKLAALRASATFIATEGRA